MSEQFDGEFLSVMSRIGARPEVDDPTRGSVLVTDHLSSNGMVRVAPLMMVADSVVGMGLEDQTPDWTFTTDFSFRRGAVSGAPGQRISGQAAVLRHGSRLLVESMQFVDEDGNDAGYCEITFIRTPLRAGEQKPSIAGVRQRLATADFPPLDAPLADMAGIVVADAATGRIVLEPHAAIRRPGGFVQGAIMTLAGEVAAQALAEHHLGPSVITDFDARYLMGGRDGPLTTAAHFIGPPENRSIRVTLTDEGHLKHGKPVVSCTFLARVRSA